MDIWQHILNYCDIRSQLKLFTLGHYLHYRLLINILCDSKTVTENILRQNKYRHLLKLDVRNNPNITNVSFLTNLIELNASGSDCGINQDGIKGLKLRKLNINTNSKIVNVSFMTTLVALNIGRYCVPTYHDKCNVNQDGIDGLNLVKLDAFHNSKITNVSLMTNLLVLNAGWNCGINQVGIHGLNLFKLYIHDNPNITDLKFMIQRNKRLRPDQPN